MTEPPKVGEPFDPRRKVCGFYACDAVDRDTTLGLSDGAKRIYDRLYRLALKTGKCYASTPWLAEALGKSSREVERDLHDLVDQGLLRRVRHGRSPRSLEFVMHPIHQRAPATNPPTSADQAECSNPPSLADQTESPIRHPASSNPPSVAHNPPTLARKPERLIIREPETPPPPPSPQSGAGPVPVRGKADDDEAAWESPEAELQRRLRERHGDRVDGWEVQRQVREKLEVWGLTLLDFLKLDSERTTNGRALRNPIGHYLALAEMMISQRRGRLANNPQRLQRAINEAARRRGWM